MPDLDPTVTLAEIVTTNPRSARILESYALDYCCGGSQTLGQACARAKVDVRLVIDRIGAEEQDEPAEWASMGLTDLVDHVQTTHHAYLDRELGRLSELAAKVASVHGDRHPELHTIRDVYESLRAELEPHLRKEEQVLFPMVRELAESTSMPSFHCGSLRNPISVMLNEHDRAGSLLAHLRASSGGYVPPADGCASYQALFAGLQELEADTHLHVHKENNLLFPAVVRREQELNR